MSVAARSNSVSELLSARHAMLYRFELWEPRATQHRCWSLLLCKAIWKLQWYCSHSGALPELEAAGIDLQLRLMALQCTRVSYGDSS